MKLYLTGASSSKEKTGTGSSQNDVGKSLGGYISNSEVPNGEVNGLFDLVSLMTLESGEPETVAIALVNDLDVPVTNLSLRVITDSRHVAEFEVSAVATDGYVMEHIANRYAQPLNATFYTADFYRAETICRIDTWAGVGNVFTIQPFGVVVDNVLEASYDGTFDAIEEAFARTSWEVKRISRRRFRITRRDESTVTPVLPTITDTTSTVAITFSTYKNEKTDSVQILTDEQQLAPGGAIGLWIRRSIKKQRRKSDEQMIKEWKTRESKYVETTEKTDLLFDYDEVTP